MICRTCRQPVDTYRPTGAPRLVRAIRHPESAYAVGGYQCPGSFEAVDPEPVQRPRFPANDGGPSVTEYLRSRGEL